MSSLRRLVSLTCFFMLIVSTSCSPDPPKPNQTQDLPSPSGKYVLSAPLEKDVNYPDQPGAKVRRITIFKADGTLEYKDESAIAVGLLFDLHWGWDAQDQVWIYNSDDGGITRWTKESGEWTKHINQSINEIPNDILPEHKRR